MHKKLVIVADDFTGANDTGVQFRKAGLTVHVIINISAIREAIHRCDVLVIDLETRLLSPSEAYQANFRAGKELAQIGDCIIYKKIDSTFRGNIGAEIDGLMDALQLKITFLAAAWPVNGRITRNGLVYVHNVMLADTEAKDDPRSPVEISRIADIIGSQSDRVCCQVPESFCLLTADKQNEFITEETNKGSEIFIFDSLTESDLDAVAKAIEGNYNVSCLLVGSAGLASHICSTGLLRSLPLAFIFAGSISKKTRDQITYAAKQGNFEIVSVEAEALLDGTLNSYDLISKISAICEETNRFIFTTAADIKDVIKVYDYGKERNWDQYETAGKLSHEMGNLAATLIRSFNPSVVVLTGGETAINTVRALGASGLEIDRELFPGIQTGTLTGCSTKSLVVTKAGGFGEPDAFVNIFQFLKV